MISRDEQLINKITMVVNESAPNADDFRQHVMNSLKSHYAHNAAAAALESIGSHEEASKHWRTANDFHHDAHAAHKEAISRGFEPEDFSGFTQYKKAARELIQEKMSDALS